VGRLQPVAHDVALRAHTLELARVVRPLDRDVADALVPEARPHRLLRQQDDRMVDREGDRATRATDGAWSAAYVCTTRSSTLIGKLFANSSQLRSRSKPRTPKRVRVWRGNVNVGTSPSTMSVTSMTDVPLPRALISNDCSTGAKFEFRSEEHTS